MLRKRSISEDFLSQISVLTCAQEKQQIENKIPWTKTIELNKIFCLNVKKTNLSVYSLHKQILHIQVSGSQSNGCRGFLDKILVFDQFSFRYQALQAKEEREVAGAKCLREKKERQGTGKEVAGYVEGGNPERMGWKNPPTELRINGTNNNDGMKTFQ